MELPDRIICYTLLEKTENFAVYQEKASKQFRGNKHRLDQFLRMMEEMRKYGYHFACKTGLNLLDQTQIVFEKDKKGGAE